jgi:hypothetical protein
MECVPMVVERTKPDRDFTFNNDPTATFATRKQKAPVLPLADTSEQNQSKTEG